MHEQMAFLILDLCRIFTDHHAFFRVSGFGHRDIGETAALERHDMNPARGDAQEAGGRHPTVQEYLLNPVAGLIVGDQGTHGGFIRQLPDTGGGEAIELELGFLIADQSIHVHAALGPGQRDCGVDQIGGHGADGGHIGFDHVDQAVHGAVGTGAPQGVAGDDAADEVLFQVLEDDAQLLRLLVLHLIGHIQHGDRLNGAGDNDVFFEQLAVIALPATDTGGVPIDIITFQRGVRDDFDVLAGRVRSLGGAAEAPDHGDGVAGDNRNLNDFTVPLVLQLEHGAGAQKFGKTGSDTEWGIRGDAGDGAAGHDGVRLEGIFLPLMINLLGEIRRVAQQIQ